MATKGKKEQIKEASVVIKPIGATGGLDAIHIALAVLVIILIALLIAVAYTKPVPLITNTTASNINCTYAVQSGKCTLPINTPSQIKQDAEVFLASYNYLNSSISPFLTYFSNVSRMNLTYNPINSEWYVTVPVQDTAINQTLQFAMIINDKNTSRITPLLQIIESGVRTNNSVVSKGVVQIPGQSTCSTQSPLQIYWFVDPYSTGGISSLVNMTSLQSTFKSQVSIGVKMLFTQASQSIAQTYGLNNSLALGSYLFCASNQSAFPSFVNRVNQAYNGGYMSSSQLSGIASQSGINGTQLNGCLSDAGTLINRQALLAKYYNITSSPLIVTDCRYLSIPQTEIEAIHYANSSIT
jgi:hypothetical protein